MAPLGARHLPAVKFKRTVAIELLVNFNEFWSRLRGDIERARESAFVQTFAFAD